jgi:anti-sigma factor RsiW
MNDDNMQDVDFQNLKEINWRRSLTPLELARVRQFLAVHPEFQHQWDEDAALDRLLQRLPAAPVSSNFTARVMQAAQCAPARSGWRQWLAARFPAPGLWLPRGALGAAMVCVGLLSFHCYQMEQRAQTARDLARVSRLAALPPMAWLKDFETIDRLNKVQVADDDLLAALQ